VKEIQRIKSDTTIAEGLLLKILEDDDAYAGNDEHNVKWRKKRAHEDSQFFCYKFRDNALRVTKDAVQKLWEKILEHLQPPEDQQLLHGYDQVRANAKRKIPPLERPTSPIIDGKHTIKKSKVQGRPKKDSSYFKLNKIFWKFNHLVKKNVDKREFKSQLDQIKFYLTDLVERKDLSDAILRGDYGKRFHTDVEQCVRINNLIGQIKNATNEMFAVNVDPKELVVMKKGKSKTQFQSCITNNIIC